LEDAALERLATELRSIPGPNELQRKEAKERVLRAVELHAQADVLVEDAVARYREDLYFLARRLAEEDLEPGLVTRTHVRQAQALLARHRRVSSWGDSLLTFGSLLTGAAIPHVIELAQRTAAPSVLIIVGGIAGALMLGMGVVHKVKN
jgi:hypothetical protein